MKLKDVKILLGELELLSVDTQPIRDLIYIIQLDSNKENKFSNLLETLKQLLNINFFSAGSAPEEIKTILKAIDGRIKEPDEDFVELGNKKDNDKDLLILSTLLGIKKEIEGIKNIKQEVRFIDTGNKDLSDIAVEMDNVFLNPIIDTSNIKTRVNIESKKEDNILNKLNLLKKFKKSQ